jgi:FixJ family two-component response regulator
MTEADGIVFVVDYDASVRQSLKNLIRATLHDAAEVAARSSNQFWDESDSHRLSKDTN